MTRTSQPSSSQPGAACAPAAKCPKQYRAIGGEPVIRRALAAFLTTRDRAVQPVIHPDDEQTFRAATAGLEDMLPPVPAAPRARLRCAPGSKRCAAQQPDIVLIHDAARPFVTSALIARAIDARRERTAQRCPRSPSPTPSS